MNLRKEKIRHRIPNQVLTMRTRVVGIVTEERESKGVKQLTTNLYLELEHEEWRKERALRLEGKRYVMEWTRLDCSGLHVGDTVDLFYEPGFQNKATLVGFKVVPQAAK